MKEIWKDIKEYEGIYQISNFGRVKRLNSIIAMKHRSGKLLNILKQERFLIPTDNGHNYLIVGLSKNNKRKNYYVHRLVAEAFIPNLENKIQVNHKNGDKSNNNIENLEWVTAQENAIHSCKVLKTKYNLTGLNISREKQKKKVCSIDEKGEVIEIFDSIAEAGRKMKVQPSVICGCCKGIYKTCRGLRWKYLD